MKITLEQKEQIIALFNTPSSQLSTEKMMEQIETEMGITVPKDLWSEFFESGFALTLRNRPRKNVPVVKEVKPKKEVKKVFTFEFEAADGQVEEVTLVRGKKTENSEDAHDAQELENGASPVGTLRMLPGPTEAETNVQDDVAENTSSVEEIQQFGDALNSSFETLVDDNQ
jgi:hypothetical protein